MTNKIDPCDTMRVNLIAAAIGLQQCTKTASNIVPIPGGDRVIAIGTPAQVRTLLAADIDTPPLTGAELDKLEALARAAKASTWTAVKHNWSNIGIYSNGRPVACLDISSDAMEETQEALEAEMDADAVFMVAACNAIPTLIAQARAQQETAAAHHFACERKGYNPLCAGCEAERGASQPPAPVVAAGWKMVPVEPTIAMIAALAFKGDEMLAIGHALISKDVMVDYAAMLNAAPPAPMCHAPAGLLAEILSLAETGMCQGLVADDYCSQIVAKIKAAPDAAHAGDPFGPQRWSKEAEMMESWAAHAQQDAAPAHTAVIEAARRDIIDFLRASNDEDCANRVEEFMTAQQIAKNIAAVAPSDAKGKAGAANAGGQAVAWRFRTKGAKHWQVTKDAEFAATMGAHGHIEIEPLGVLSATSAADAKDAEQTQAVNADRVAAKKAAMVTGSCKAESVMDLCVDCCNSGSSGCAVIAAQQAAPVAKCKRCDGKGLVPNSSPVRSTCPICHGTGIADLAAQQAQSSAKGGDAVGGAA